MINISLDTNLIIGIINPEDRLHEKAIEILSMPDIYFVFSGYTLSEARETLLKKFHSVASKIIVRLRDIDLAKNPIEYRTRLTELFKELISKDESMESFYKYFYKIEDLQLSVC